MQQRIASSVAKAIVYRFEPVEVQEDQRIAVLEGVDQGVGVAAYTSSSSILSRRAQVKGERVLAC